MEHKALPTLVQAATGAFKEEVYAHVRGDVARAVAAEMRREREGEAVDRGLLRRVVGIFEAMGDGSLDEYEDDLQGVLLGETEAYYTAKAAAWVAEESVPANLARVEGLLGEETDRCVAYLLPSSEAPLLRVAVDVLLARLAPQLLDNDVSGLRALLRNAGERRDDLARLYRLFARVDGGLDSVARYVREHFSDMGGAVVKERDAAAAALASGGSSSSSSSAAAGGAGDAAAGGEGKGAGAGASSSSSTSAAGGEDGVAASGAKAGKKAGGGGGKGKASEDPADPAFVTSLLAIHTQAAGLVTVEFQNNQLFQKAVKDAFESFVNKEVPSSKYSNAEMIATYADRVLKAGGGEKLSDEQIETELDRVCALFVYITDKDVFGEIYRNQLVSGEP